MVGEINLNVKMRSEMKPFMLLSHFITFGNIHKKKRKPSFIDSFIAMLGLIYFESNLIRIDCLPSRLDPKERLDYSGPFELDI